MILYWLVLNKKDMFVDAKDLFLARAKIPITLSSSTHEHIHSVVRKIPLKDKDW